MQSDAEHGKENLQSSACPKPCCQETFTSVIDDDIGLNDESASIVIVGGGPHALAALAALHEGSLAFQQYGNDNLFEARVGFNSHEKVGTGECSSPPRCAPCRKLNTLA